MSPRATLPRRGCTRSRHAVSIGPYPAGLRCPRWRSSHAGPSSSPATRPGPVVVVIGIPQDPRALAAKLSLDLDDPLTNSRSKTTDRAKTNGQASSERAETETEPVNLDSRLKIKDALDKVTGDRSRDINRIVGACYDAGLTLAQACWCVDRRADLVEKLGENTKRDDVLECWLKIDKDRRTRKAEASAPRDDRVITLVPASEIVSDIPDWVWEHKNRCRIFTSWNNE